MAGKVKAVRVPVNERTYIHGDSELMGYVGLESWDALKANYLDLGLRPRLRGRKKLYKRAEVDKFIEDNDEWQEVKIKL
jgi:hypothetical protein